MKLSHRIVAAAPPVDPVWSDRVEREAEADSAARALAYAHAEKRLLLAQEKLDRAVLNAPKATRTRAVQKAEGFVEARRSELLALARLMQESPSSAVHRGTKSFRPVHPPQKF